MNDDAPIYLTPSELRSRMDTLREEEYLLVDVRQPAEYAAAHLPGAMPLPLPELETKIYSLPSDRELIFYCHSGSRSQAAADLAIAAEVTEKPVYILWGGMITWDGKRLDGFPKVDLFDAAGGMEGLMQQAMELEKGAWKFYRVAGQSFSNSPAAAVMHELETAETAHAKMIYGIWKRQIANPPPFDSLYDSLEGGILEGGQTLQAAVNKLSDVSEHPCISIIELALDIEYSAFDLYRTMAESHGIGDEERQAWRSLSQAEKGHMRKLIRAIETCEQTGSDAR